MNRLEFLKTLGTLGVAAIVAPKMLGVSKDPKRYPSKAQNLEANLSKPVTVVILGAGQRGQVYAAYAKEYPACMKVIGVADINKIRLENMANEHNVPENCRFGDWSEALSKARFADAVVISLPDNLHFEPCMKALDLGYNVLLEKPVAPTETECKAICDKALETGAIVGVCHVLRYAPYFVAMKSVVDSGVLGELISVQHLEPVRYHHMAHSYVRGNWHNSLNTTPIILAKSCHDLDIIRWVVGSPCKSIAAYGNLQYFNKAHCPEGATARCTDGCPHEATCPYSAIDIYCRKGQHTYVFDNLPESEPERRDAIMEQLRKTDYGRCVFDMDNDQCDHYVASIEFENGVTASFAMEAFTATGGRRTYLMGTHGELVGDMKKFVITDFRTGNQTVWDDRDVKEIAAYVGHGHGGGDLCLTRDFVNAVGNNDMSYLTSDITVSTESHIMGFAAERSRLNGTKESIHV